MLMKRVFVLFLALAAFFSSCSGATIKDYSIKLVAQYPHDDKAYTQGLFFYDGCLYESTGQYAHSTLRRVDLESGKVKKKVNFARKYFGEGSVALNGNIYVLTWTNKMLYVYDADSLSFVKGYSYPREGWGLTTDGKQLIASDGTSTLYFFDENISLQKTLKVTADGRPVHYLNELEYIDGKIWANVYMTDMIVIIDPADGKVVGRIDCRGLLPASLRTDETDVLNGIAYEPESGRIFLTGKNWPRLYEVAIIKSSK